MDLVWPDSNVTEDSLTQCISTLRRALGDDPNHPRFIATVSRRGYRFIAPVSEVLSAVPNRSDSPVPEAQAPAAPVLAAAPAPLILPQRPWLVVVLAIALLACLGLVLVLLFDTHLATTARTPSAAVGGFASPWQRPTAPSLIPELCFLPMAAVWPSSPKTCAPARSGSVCISSTPPNPGFSPAPMAPICRFGRPTAARSDSFPTAR